MIRKILSDIYRYFYPLSNVEMYKRMGVEIGDNCKIQFDVNIDYSHYWLVSIGNNVTIAPRVHILAHDTSTFNFTGYTRLGKVKIEDGVFIGAGSIILPGVVIGKDSIVGAGSVVNKDVKPGIVVAGNPAKEICSVEAYKHKVNQEMANSPVFEEDYTLRKGIDIKKQKEMILKIGNKVGFVR